MKLLRLAAWVAWFTFAWASAAHAGGVAAAIMAVGSWLGSSVVGKLILGIALHVGNSLLQKAMAKKQAEPGITGQVQVGGTNSLTFIIGTYATAGQLEYIGTHGRIHKSPNAFLTQVISLSDMPVTAISNDAWIDGVRASRNISIPGRGSAKFGADSFPFDEFVYEGWHFLFAKYRLGDQTTPDPNMLAAFPSGARPWLADMIGRGVAHVILNAEVKRELFKSFPTGRWQVDGIRLYDPRLDSTVGGNGPQRWGQEGTYAFSNNVAVMIYNIMRGIYYQGEWVYGPEIPALALPLSNWFAAMNECDRPIALAGGGTERQFRAGAEIKTAEMEPADVIEELLVACNGRIAEIGGTYKIHVGAPALPVYFFTDDNIEVLNSDQDFDPFPGFENTFNGVSAAYPEPSAAWEMKDAPLYVNAAHVAADGEQRLAEVTYNAVPFAEQVQRLMRSTAEDNRRFRRHQMTLPPEAWLLEPLDSVSWTSNRNGYSAKVFPITAMEDMDNCNQRVSLQEADPSDYDWSPSFELPWTVGDLAPNRPGPQLLTGWQVAPAIIYDEQGRARRPSIQVYFDGDLEDIREVRIVVRLFSSKVVAFDALLPYGEPDPDNPQRSVILNGVFLPNELYEVSGILIPFGARQMEWSAWLPVTTPDVRLGDLDVYLDLDVDGINELIVDRTEWLRDGSRELIDELLAVATTTADQQLANYVERQAIRTQLSSDFNDGLRQTRADYLFAIDVATGPGSGLSQRIESLEVEVGDNLASAVSGLTTRIDTVDGRVTATAQSVDALTATVGDAVASLFIRGQVEASPGGGWVRYGVYLANENAESVFFLDVAGTQSRAVFSTDQFIISNGSALTRPFIFQDGRLTADELWVNAARITGTLDGNIINAHTVAINRLVLGGITYDYLAQGAVTHVELFDDQSDISIRNSQVVVAQRTINGVPGRRRKLSFSAYLVGDNLPFEGSETWGIGCTMIIRRGNASGPVIKTVDIMVPRSNGGQRAYGTVLAEAYDYDGAASQQYTVTATGGVLGSGSSTTVLRYRLLSIEEHRA